LSDALELDDILDDEPPRGDRPVLTFPPVVAEAVREAYAAATTILEFGSGGSTALAAEMPGKTVFSVESDGAWLRKMRAWFDANPPAADVRLHHADIGPTVKWGRPRDTRFFRRWPRYALSVWDRPDFRQPDLVLIDGRFRVACLLATAYRIDRPVTVLFDDYLGREPYRAVEEIAKPVAMHGRMARFDLTPQPITPDRLVWIVNYLLRPH
jgi:hypothetical protein